MESLTGWGMSSSRTGSWVWGGWGGVQLWHWPPGEQGWLLVTLPVGPSGFGAGADPLVARFWTCWWVGLDFH